MKSPDQSSTRAPSLRAMAFNSSLGSRRVVRAMLRHPHAQLMANKPMRALFSLLGPVAIRICGWPLDVEGRALARSILRALVREVPLGGRILDAGSSYSPHSFELARRKYEVIAVDLSMPSLRLGKAIDAQLRSGVSFALMDVCRIGLKDDSFDAVLCSHVLEHVKDHKSAVEEFWRVLKAHGLLILALPYSSEPVEYSEPVTVYLDRIERLPGATGGHWRSGYNERTISNLLTDRGFSVERISRYGYPSFLPRSAMLFPLLYPISIPLSRLGINRFGLTVTARKAGNGGR